MRITAKVSGAGANGLTRIPFLDIKSIDADLCTDGHLDEAKCRKVLNHPDDGIQIASDDCLPVFAFGTELVKQVYDACQKLISERRNGDTTAAHDRAVCADDRHAERNMKKGRWVYVRTDITFNVTGGKKPYIKLRINVDNPKGVVGVAERIALDYALIQARVANHIKDELTNDKRNEWEFVYIGGPGCPSLFDDARRIETELTAREEVRKANAARCSCPHCHVRNGRLWCGPDADGNLPKDYGRCPHYGKNAECVEVTA